MECISVNNDHNVKYITFDRDNKRNALNNEMSNDIITAIEEAENEEVKVIVIQAAQNAKVFSAGYDLSELNTIEDLYKGSIFKLFHKIRDTEIPVIAKVDGAVYAGALHLLMVCDIVLATNFSSVSMTLNRMGIPLDIENYKYWLDVMGIHKVKELFFTALPIDATDAYIAGIFNDVDSLENINLKLNTIIDGILHCSFQGIANSKMQINKIADSMVIDNKTTAFLEKTKSKIMKSKELIQNIRNLKYQVI
ncbi:MAG TPA: enoyl-CoA hydratase-related protein [Victivallales bacterium]|nr:enoyl-CoA hydratase-related protein [Victivallales bacterium]